MEASNKNLLILASASMNSLRCSKASNSDGDEEYRSNTSECFFSKSIVDCVKTENSSSFDLKKRKIESEQEINEEGEVCYKIAPEDEEVFVVKTLMVRKKDGSVVNLKKTQETLFKRNQSVVKDTVTDFVYRGSYNNNAVPDYYPPSPKYTPLYYPPSPQYTPTSLMCDLTPDIFKSTSPPLSPLSSSFFFDFEL